MEPSHPKLAGKDRPVLVVIGRPNSGKSFFLRLARSNSFQSRRWQYEYLQISQVVKLRSLAEPSTKYLESIFSTGTGPYFVLFIEDFKHYLLGSEFLSLVGSTLRLLSQSKQPFRFGIVLNRVGPLLSAPDLIEWLVGTYFAAWAAMSFSKEKFCCQMLCLPEINGRASSDTRKHIRRWFAQLKPIWGPFSAIPSEMILPGSLNTLLVHAGGRAKEVNPTTRGGCYRSHLTKLYLLRLRGRDEAPSKLLHFNVFLFDRFVRTLVRRDTWPAEAPPFSFRALWTALDNTQGCPYIDCCVSSESGPFDHRA